MKCDGSLQSYPFARTSDHSYMIRSSAITEAENNGKQKLLSFLDYFALSGPILVNGTEQLGFDTKCIMRTKGHTLVPFAGKSLNRTKKE